MTLRWLTKSSRHTNMFRMATAAARKQEHPLGGGLSCVMSPDPLFLCADRCVTAVTCSITRCCRAEIVTSAGNGCLY